MDVFVCLSVLRSGKNEWSCQKIGKAIIQCPLNVLLSNVYLAIFKKSQKVPKITMCTRRSQATLYLYIDM